MLKISFLDTILSLGCASCETTSAEDIWAHILLCTICDGLSLLYVYTEVAIGSAGSQLGLGLG